MIWIIRCWVSAFFLGLYSFTGCSSTGEYYQRRTVFSITILSFGESPKDIDPKTGIEIKDGQIVNNMEIDPEIQDRERGFPGGIK